MKKLSFADAPAVLFEFESALFDQIKPIQIDGWNIWSICKVPLFYYLIRSSEGVEQQLPVKKAKNPSPVFHSIIKYIRSYNRKRCTLFLTHSADKLSVNEQGLFYNAIIHPILELGVLKETLVVEYPTINGFLEPARFDRDIDGRIVTFLGRIKVKIGKKQLDASSQSEILCGLLNGFLRSKGYCDEVTKDIIQNFVALFFIQKESYYTLFKRRKPTCIIGSELMASGALAAAAELNIPVVEIQHGAIDNHYPPYVWHNGFSTLDKVLKPTRVLVFGDFAKEIIVKSGFFAADEIIPVGYHKIEEIRNKYKNIEVPTRHQMLVVVQPMMHELNLSIIRQLLQLTNRNYKILFKVHPLQPENEKEDYKALLKHSDIQFIDGKENIHNLIMSSDIVVGHVTTCLEEALSLGKPSLTITTESLPEGIHSMTGAKELKKLIRPCVLADLERQVMIFFEDQDLRNAWESAIAESFDVIYKKDYKKNITDFFSYSIVNCKL